MRLFEIVSKALKWLCHRYYLSKIKGSTASLALRGNMSIVSPEKITVGEYCCINDGVQIHAGGGITLGNNVTISMGSKLITRSYETSEWIEQCARKEPDMKHIQSRIVLNDHTWICAGAIILPGVNITGRGVIVSAGTILSKDIKEDYVIVAGSPARIVKHY